MSATLLIGNNVLAHVPDVNDFVAGLSILLAPGGTLTMEFPHVLRLLEESQFDTIYHEHFSYLSLLTVRSLFASHGLTVTRVEVLPTHGGSLRVFARHAAPEQPVDPSVADLEATERQRGLTELGTYQRLAKRAGAVKAELLAFLAGVQSNGKRVAAYGAPAKGNTLLNYLGVDTGSIEYTVDRSPHKQGLFLPGSRIPIRSPDHILADRPDYVLILPWNLREEVAAQMSAIRDWGGQFVVPIPDVTVF